jgi:hypothetical protein
MYYLKEKLLLCHSIRFIGSLFYILFIYEIRSHGINGTSLGYLAYFLYLKNKIIKVG